MKMITVEKWLEEMFEEDVARMEKIIDLKSRYFDAHQEAIYAERTTKMTVKDFRGRETEVTGYIIQIDGYELIDTRFGTTGRAKYLKLNRIELTRADENLLMYGPADRLKIIRKRIDNHRKAIEAKVAKICGDHIVEVCDEWDGVYVKGENNRIAHLWAIRAGGYNIQCLHTRVLVKEVKGGK